MASEQSEVLKATYEHWMELLGRSTEQTMDLPRLLYATWGAHATEASGVSYETIDAGGVPGIAAIPPDDLGDAAILFVHGGGYVGGEATGHRKLVGHIAKAAGVRAVAIDYRLVPEHTFPAPLEDARQAFDWLVSTGIAPGRILLVGDSAGGAIVTGLSLSLRDSGSALAGGVVALSPWYDVECVGESIVANAEKDALSYPAEAVAETVKLILGGKPVEDDPYFNALRSDPTGLPPFFISFGEDEALIDGGRLYAELLRSKDVDVELEVVPEMQHVFQFLAGTAPEADASISRIGEFVRHRLGAAARS